MLWSIHIELWIESSHYIQQSVSEKVPIQLLSEIFSHRNIAWENKQVLAGWKLLEIIASKSHFQFFFIRYDRCGHTNYRQGPTKTEKEPTKTDKKQRNTDKKLIIPTTDKKGQKVCAERVICNVILWTNHTQMLSVTLMWLFLK